MTMQLSSVEIAPQITQRFSVIWMHGLGADGHDFEGIVPELTLSHSAETRFIFPNAPIQAVTINGGMKMPAWYDILEMTLERRVDLEGIYRSAAQIEQIIAREMAQGIPAANILLAGFSQGGVIALHTALRYPERLAGVLALSTYLPTLSQLSTEAAESNKQTPIFMAHGTQDNIVDLSVAKQAFQGLHALQYPVQWHEYPMAHSLCQAEIAAISTFINQVFN